MPVPSSIADLSTSPGSNYPAGSESVTSADDYLRTHAAFIAQLNANDATDRADLASTASGKGAQLVGVPGSTDTAGAKLQRFRLVTDYGTVGDGATSDQAAVAAAVAAALAAGDDLWWPDGTYLTTASIPSFHSVRHFGAGIIKRGSNLWAVEPKRTTVRGLYVSPTGSTANDGLSTGEPLTIQGAIDALNFAGPVIGRQQIIGVAGQYNEAILIPAGLAINDNYLEFKFPSTPGVRGDPSTWPAGGAILDGTTNDANSKNGFEIGAFNRVYVEYLLVRDWYNTALSSVSQVKRGFVVNEHAYLFAYGCSAFGNGWSNIACDPNGQAIVTGGILDGARYGMDNTGGRLSLTATSGVSQTTVRNALEYGLYCKHNASSVLNYTEFANCGQLAAAASYGAALFAYKSGASIDTLGCVFTNNNIVYHARGGFIATNPTVPDTMGTAGTANDRIWLVRGYGADDLVNFQTKAARELSVSNGGNSTTSTTAVVIFDTNGQIPAGYLTQADAHIEIEIFCSNAAGGTAQIRPSFVGTVSGTRYELANFTLAASAFAHIRMIVQPVTGGATASLWWATQGATIGGATSGFTGSVTIPFNTDTLEFQVWGEAASGTVTVRKTRVMLWG